MMKSRGTIRCIGCVAALAALACDGGAPVEERAAAGPGDTRAASASAAASGSGSRRVIIRMRDDMTFDPPVARIAAGDTVVWLHDGSIPHTTTGDPAAAGNPDHARLPHGAMAWDSGLLESGATHARVFTVPGEYTYLCTLHEALGMIGQLEVVAEDVTGGN